MSDGVDPTAHEIIILSPEYHLSVHFPQGSLYVDVWLGINNRTNDLLLHLSELRRKALDTSPAEEMATSPMSTASTSSPDFPPRASPTSRSRSTSSSTVTMSADRRDSVCDQHHPAPQSLNVSVRHSDHGLFNCPLNTPASEWLLAKESIATAQSICHAHHTKFHQSVDKIQKLHKGPQIPDLDPLKRLLDDFLAKNNQSPGALTTPACCICSASPYTRLFFSML
ncbi:hypothetical protein LPJ59_000570 [Coemansia sp. RSA 2399]|nr:hypothetical protein LPJ59_000570 [Coemansia sp. RSA 2399]KAJ1908218.1 hypothetical protein LPJ81_000232 [Coemansia sp. IMI 209127]